MEGTYPLPEAQLDRFMLKIHLGSPDLADLAAIVERTTGTEEPDIAKAADAQRIEQMKQLVRHVALASHVTQYIARVVLATHAGGELACPLAQRYVRYGASPRGAQAIVLASKVHALCAGRANVAFSDIRAVTVPALRHRLILSFEGQAEGVKSDDIIEEILETIPQAETV